MIADAKGAGRDAQTRAISLVSTKLKAADAAMRLAEEEHVSLSDSKDYSFVEEFMFAQGSHFQVLVTRYCGVPTPSVAARGEGRRSSPTDPWASRQ